MEMGKMINKISNRLRRRSAAIQESVGLSGAQCNVLDYILIESMSHPVYQKEIEQEFGLRPSTATEALKQLESKELIRREPDAKDARYKKIIFTPKANEIKAIMRNQIETSEALLLQGLTQKEIDTFLKIASKMLENLDRAEEGQSCKKKETGCQVSS